MCTESGVLVFLIIANRILKLIQIIAPILAIIALTFWLFKKVQNPDDPKILKRIRNSVIALFVVFLLPFIAKYVINIAATQTNAGHCLEPEEWESLKEEVFKPAKYIEIDDNVEHKPIVPNPDDYEYGNPKEESGSGDTITGPSTGNAFYFLNVGASSDAILIQDEGKFGLVDTGIWGKGSYVVKQLKKLGVSTLDFVLITHAHGDHIGGYDKVMSNFKVKRLIIKAGGRTGSYTAGSYRSMIKKAQKNGAVICDAESSGCQSFTLGNIGFRLYNTKFINTPKLSPANRCRFENANSLVAVATLNGRRVYLAGDIGNYFGYKRESIVAKAVGDIDVYKVAHHGYVSFNNHQDAVNYLKSDYAVITNGRKRSNTALSRIRRSVGKTVPAYYTAERTVVMTVDTAGNIKFIK